MSQPKRRKYRKFSCVRGGQYARTIARDLDLEQWLDREMQTVYACMRDPRGTTPSAGIAEINAGDQHPWRIQGRRTLEAILADVADDKLDEMPFVWQRFIQRCRDLKRRGLLRVRVVGTGTTPASPAERKAA